MGQTQIDLPPGYRPEDVAGDDLPPGYRPEDVVEDSPIESGGKHTPATTSSRARYRLGSIKAEQSEADKASTVGGRVKTVMMDEAATQPELGPGIAGPPDSDIVRGIGTISRLEGAVAGGVAKAVGAGPVVQEAAQSLGTDLAVIPTVGGATRLVSRFSRLAKKAPAVAKAAVPEMVSVPRVAERRLAPRMDIQKETRITESMNAARAKGASEEELADLRGAISKNLDQKLDDLPPGYKAEDVVDVSKLSDKEYAAHGRRMAQRAAMAERATLVQESVNAGKPANAAKPSFAQSVTKMHEDAASIPGLKMDVQAGPATTLGPESVWSKSAALRSKFGMAGLRQLEDADQVLAQKFRGVATAKSGAVEMLGPTAQRINKAMGADDGFDKVRAVLTESRLRGIEDYYRQTTRELSAIPDEQLIEEFGTRWEPELQAIARQGQFKVGKQSANTVANRLAERGDANGLRQLLSQAYDEASRRVAHVLKPEEFDAIRALPGYQEAKKAFREGIEAPLRESHLSNVGKLDERLGPEGVYIPLSGTDEKPIFSAFSRAPYAKPRNPWNEYATGMAKQYDLSARGLRGHIEQGLRANALADALRTAEARGAMREIKPFKKAPDEFEYKGRTFTTSERLPLSGDQKVIDGKTVPAQRMAMPEWLHKELRPILEDKKMIEGGEALAKTRETLFKAAVFGPFDLVFHGTNMFGTMVGHVPYIGKTKLGTAIGNLPVIKTFATVKSLADVRPKTAEFAADVAFLRKNGLISDRFGTETYSKKYANAIGAEVKRVTGGPILYGPEGLDIRSRVAALRALRKIEPGFDHKTLYDFVNRLGNYTYQLSSGLSRGVKKSGLSPFYTAGSTMNWNAITALLGTGKAPGAFAKTSALANGGLGATILWVGAYKAYQDKYPWEDPNMKLFKIPLKPEHAKALGWAYDPDKKGTKYIGVIDLFVNPLVARGARAIGLTGVAETKMRGGSGGQVFEGGLRSAMNANLHPFAGPPAQMLSAGVLGREPYITSLRDDRGRPAAELMPSVKKATAPGIPTALARGEAALEGLNPLLGSLATATRESMAEGVAETLKKRGGKFATDIVAPRLFAGSYDSSKDRKRLKKERSRFDKNAYNPFASD